MTYERWRYPMANMDAELTPEELTEGWHFCEEYDGLLTQGEDPEQVKGEKCLNCGFNPKEISK
jgi:hypothetical protein